MNRKTTKNDIIKLINKIRIKMPNAIIRTSLIVGFPGETNKDFEELLQFIYFAKFDKMGAFMYSKEEGTPAEKLPNQIHGNTKKARYNKIMQVQQQISRKNLENKIGKKYEVIIEQISFDGKYLIGRTIEDIPEIDGVVYIKLKNDEDKKYLNKFKFCKIIDVSNYDLIAEIMK